VYHVISPRFRYLIIHRPNRTLGIHDVRVYIVIIDILYNTHLVHIFCVTLHSLVVLLPLNYVYTKHQYSWLEEKYEPVLLRLASKRLTRSTASTSRVNPVESPTPVGRSLVEIPALDAG